MVVERKLLTFDEYERFSALPVREVFSQQEGGEA
jgi:hypothetical protein